MSDDLDFAQADIDALFGDVGAPAPQKSGLRAIVEADVINHQRLPMLEVVCDRLIRTFSTNMRNLTSDAIDVSLDTTTSVRFGEFMNRVPLPAMFGVFRVEEWENYGIVVVDSALIYSVVDALLGGVAMADRAGSTGAASPRSRLRSSRGWSNWPCPISPRRSNRSRRSPLSWSGSRPARASQRSPARAM